MKNDNLLPRSSPSLEGLNPEYVITFIDQASKSDIELHSLMIVKNGKVVTEGWWLPYSPETLHGCYSVTKTFTACAIGLAIGEGLLSLTDKLFGFFPDKLPENPSENLLSLTIHDLLCMGCGQDDEPNITNSDDAVKTFFLTDFVHKPGTVFRYNSIASHMLAEVIFSLTGVSLPEYLEPRLFKPLGISNIRWDKTPQGLPMGGWGIHLKTEDLAKMGLLFLNHGKWNGIQILPTGWTETASSKHIESENNDSEWGMGYCYQMWRGIPSNSYRLDGAFGQFSVILPDQNAVVTITEATNKTDVTLELIRKYLIPAMSDTQLQLSDSENALAEKLHNLSLKENRVGKRSPLENLVSGKKYVFEDNKCSLVPESERFMAFEQNCGIHSITLSFTEKFCAFKWLESERETSIAIGLDGNYIDTLTQLTFIRQPIKSVGFWENESTFKFVMRAIEEPHAIIVSLVFHENKVTISYTEAMNLHEADKIISLTGIDSDSLPDKQA